MDEELRRHLTGMEQRLLAGINDSQERITEVEQRLLTRINDSQERMLDRFTSVDNRLAFIEGELKLIRNDVGLAMGSV